MFAQVLVFLVDAFGPQSFFLRYYIIYLSPSVAVGFFVTKFPIPNSSMGLLLFKLSLDGDDIGFSFGLAFFLLP